MQPIVIKPTSRTIARRVINKRNNFSTQSLFAKTLPLDFLQSYFHIYDTETLLELYDCQTSAIAEALRQDANGNYIYDTVLWSWMKKSAKSTIVAAIADYVACTKDKARIRLIANDRKQADSRVGYYMRENIKIGARKGYGNSELSDYMQQFRQATKITPSGYTIEYPNGSIIEMVPIDPTGEAGGNDDLIIFSELWGWSSKAHQLMWVETTIAPTRWGKAQRWIDTYAGFTGESPILENLYTEVVKDDNRLDVIGNPECYATGKLFAVWCTKHHFKWQTPEYYASERQNLTDSQFRRLHLNEWIMPVDSFVQADWYDACVDSEIPPLGLHDEIVIALDAAVSSDCFAIVAVSRDRRYPSKFTSDGYEAPDRLIKRYARAWTPPKNGKLAFWSDNPDEITPTSELKRLIKTYNVVQVTFDPYQLEHFVNQLEHESDAWFSEFNQMGEREISDKQLYDMIREGRIAHDGRDEILRSHVLNSAAKILNDDRKLRIVKKTDDRKIDLCVSLAMACKRACDLIAK